MRRSSTVARCFAIFFSSSYARGTPSGVQEGSPPPALPGWYDGSKSTCGQKGGKNLRASQGYKDDLYTGVATTTREYLYEVQEPVYAKPHWSTANTMEVILEADREYNKEDLENMYDEFDDLFDAFAKRNGTHYTKRDLQRDETFYQYGRTMTKYGVHGADCQQFQKFLLELRPQKYHLRYAHVRCGRMTFSVCLAFSCPNDPFKNVTMREKW
ncbi:hypothetical protein Y032_0452g1700 [Ancylostoma ceylanicum]|nr:hypothetical protein Y032_0452g1700 [Ancylostoma ceylanicum]